MTNGMQEQQERINAEMAKGPQPGSPAALSAPITMQDVRLVAGEGKLPAWAVLDAVNVILRRRAEMIYQQRMDNK